MPHIKIQPSPLQKQSKLERFSRVGEHIFFALSGVLLVAFPPQAIRDSTFWWVIPVLAGFLFFAAIPAAISSYKGKFKAEFVSVIFICGTISIITLTLWVATLINMRGTTAVFACLFTAFSLKLLGRFGTLNRYIKEQLGGTDKS